jgi:hypothetical protein
MFFKKKPIEPLRNCAFCGGIPRLTRCGDQKEFLVYQCSHCYESPVRFHEARVSEKGARERWNTRTEEAEYVLNIYNRLGRKTTILTSEDTV